MKKSIGRYPVIVVVIVIIVKGVTLPGDGKTEFEMVEEALMTYYCAINHLSLRIAKNFGDFCAKPKTY